jgi:hypothetical protein
MANRDDRYSWYSVETFDHLVVMNVVSLIKDHNVGVFNGITKKLVDITDRRVSGELFTDVSRVLMKSLAKDRTGTLAEAADVYVLDRGTLFKMIEGVAGKHRFTDATRTADQGIMWGRSAERRLKRTRELTQL